MVARAKTELWHRILTHYLPLYFPEADRFHRSSRGDWFLTFLEAFPSPHMITAMDKDAFVAAAWPVIGRRVSKAALLGDIHEKDLCMVEDSRVSSALLLSDGAVSGWDWSAPLPLGRFRRQF
jgi:hypothetical protein